MVPGGPHAAGRPPCLYHSHTAAAISYFAEIIFEFSVWDDPDVIISRCRNGFIQLI